MMHLLLMVMVVSDTANYAPPAAPSQEAENAKARQRRALASGLIIQKPAVTDM